MKRPRDSERGAILVETALVAGIILTFLLFSVQIGILGFLQVTADAASFVAARTATVGVATPGPYTASVFSQVQAGDVSNPVPAPAPTATVPVDYGYNNPAAHPNSQYQRVGGYSMLQPELAQVSVTPSKTVQLFGSAAQVHGADTEPLWTECGAHFNVANTNAACGDSSAPSNYAVNYFQQGENTPPYFVGFDDITHCLAQMPWGGTPGTYFNTQGEAQGACPTPGNGTEASDLLGIGIAERLDTDNWARTQPGVSNGAATFAETACHQKYFSEIGTFLQNYPDLLSIYATFTNPMGSQLGLLPPYAKISDMRNWNGFFDGNYAVGGGAHTDSDIQQVYNWDEALVGGEPVGSNIPIGTYATHPNLGCSSYGI